MKRQHLFRLFLVPLVAATFACGGDGGGDGADMAEDAIMVDAATAGSITGTVSFTGSAPAGDAIDMAEEPVCADKHESTPMQMPAMVGAEGGLANVFVRVSAGLPQGTWATPSEVVELDQDGCVYRPHVLGIRTGQTLTIRNSDGLLHNINAQPQNQRGFNVSQPTNMTTDRTFSREEVMIPVRCDVHGWMEAYIGVQSHPYFAVSAADGSFTIDNLPPGSYTVEAWHERYGVQTTEVTVAASAVATADFSYSESMAATAVVPLGEPIDLHDHGEDAGSGI